MDVTLEQVEKVRACTGATYEQARAALEQTGGNVLDAVILLERQGAASPGGADYSTKKGEGEPFSPHKITWQDVKQALKELLHNFLSVVVEVWKGDTVTGSVPLLIVVVLTTVSPLAVVGLTAVGLCAGYRIHITGPGTEGWRGTVNGWLDQLADAVRDAVTRKK